MNVVAATAQCFSSSGSSLVYKGCVLVLCFVKRYDNLFAYTCSYVHRKLFSRAVCFLGNILEAGLPHFLKLVIAPMVAEAIDFLMCNMYSKIVCFV